MAALLCGGLCYLIRSQWGVFRASLCDSFSVSLSAKLQILQLLFVHCSSSQEHIEATLLFKSASLTAVVSWQG